MALIHVSDLTFYYDDSYDPVFEHISFQIDSDWKTGLIARNGRGKTTLLNLLQNKYEYSGSITSPVKYDYFPYIIENKNKETIEVIEEIVPDYELWKVNRELDLLGVNGEVLYRSFQTLSNGEQTKVMLALLFSKDSNFLLIDEPTNHLDMESRMTVKAYLNEKKGFILVSHDRSLIDGCVDHVLIINKTGMEVQKGNFSSWWENKKRSDHFEKKENERLKKDISRLETAVKRTSGWADKAESDKVGKRYRGVQKDYAYKEYLATKSSRMQQQRKNLEMRQEKEINKKSELLKDLETAEDLKLMPLKYHKNTILEIKDMSISYGEKTVAEHFNLKIENGDRILLGGKNGSGKTSIIKEIVKGKIMIPSGLILSYVPQDATFLRGNLTDYAKEKNIDETLLKTLLRKFDFSRTQFEKDMGYFSGGQKKKVLIAASLCTRAHLYIWDEPLNFIDVFSRMQMEGLILKFKPTILMVEHDKSFVDKIATSVVQLEV